MFKFLRSQAKVFYWVIAGSFFLFLGLGGLTGRGCQAPGTREYEAGVIGKVNGVKLSAQEYDFTVRQQTASLRQQTPGGELNANQYAAAYSRAWDTLVREALIDQAIHDRGITVSDAEVLDAFRNNPPPALLESYRDENGQVDIERYFADLQNPDADWSRAEQYVREVYLPRIKLQEEIAAGAFVDEAEIREEYVRQNGRAVAEYIGMSYTDLQDGFEPSEDELQAWYDAHRDEYQQDAQAQVEVVRFRKVASDADAEDVRQYLLGIRDEIVSGRKDFATAAGEYSEDQGSVRSGGDLGTFDRNRMVAPFTEAAFSLPVGEISEPVRTDFGYHLIEVLEQNTDKDTGEVYQVHARHILVKITPGPDTLEVLREAAEEFRGRVTGTNFRTTAEAEALDLVAPAPFLLGRDIPTLPMTLAGGNWAFAARTGAVSPVFENDDMLYVVHKVGQIPPGTAPLETVRGQVSLAVRQEHNREQVRAKLEPAVADIRAGASLADAAAAHGLSHAVTDTFTINGNVPAIGYGTPFNAAAINGQVGQLVPEVETLRGLFALVPLWVWTFDEEDYAAHREGIREALLNRARAELMDAWFTEQLERAEIEDYRVTLGRGV